MLVIFSDIHLGDGTCEKPISPAAIQLPEEQKFNPYQVLTYLSFYKDDER